MSPTLHAQHRDQASIGENTPLLAPGTSASENGSERTLAGADEDHDDAKANQSVGRTRGIFIALSLWGLIFLQGKFMI